MSLDPGALSPIPSEEAVAEILRIMPQGPIMRGERRDVTAMLNAMREDALGTRATSPTLVSNTQMSGQGQEALSTLEGTTGSAFDTLFDNMLEDESIGQDGFPEGGSPEDTRPEEG